MNVLKPVLKCLVEWDGTHFGGEVAEDIRRAVNDTLKVETGHDNQIGDVLFVASYSRFAERAAFDLGLIEALPAPAEGEVVVHGARVRALLSLVETWEKTPGR